MGPNREWFRMLVLAWLAGVAVMIVGGGIAGVYWYLHRAADPRVAVVNAGVADWDGPDWYDHGMTHHRAGEYADAIDAFEHAIEAGYREDAAAYNIACGYALLGDADEAFAWLEQARQRGFDLAGYLDRDDDLASLRSDARMNALRRDSHPWRRHGRAALPVRLDRAFHFEFQVRTEPSLLEKLRSTVAEWMPG